MSYAYEHVTLLRVIDGDTIQVAIDVGFRFQTTQILRLVELDTPERGQPGFIEAKAKLQAVLADHRLAVRTFKQDSFGRWLAAVWIGEAINVSRLMREWMAEQPWATTQQPNS
jgi:Micrococcal nuclease (thermonuclease) homologs